MVLEPKELSSCVRRNRANKEIDCEDKRLESDNQAEKSKMTSHMRTLTFGDRSISYNEASDDVSDEHEHVDDDNDTDKDDSYPSSIYPCSDIDSGVCEDVCCGEHRDDTLENVVETERKIIKPDVTAIREMTNFDEVTVIK